jgi:hypothetical protein
MDRHGVGAHKPKALPESRTPADPASPLPPSSSFRYLVITDITAWTPRGNRSSPASVQPGMDDIEHEAIPAEGLDPNDAVVKAIDFVRWQLLLHFGDQDTGDQAAPTWFNRMLTKGN